MRSITPAFLCAFTLLVGCDGSEPDDTGKDTETSTEVVLDPAIELGTTDLGGVEYQSLQDGDTIYIVFGPQGGYHFNASVRVQGIDNGDPDRVDDPDNPVTTFHATRDGLPIDMGDASTYKQGIDPAPGEPGVYQMIGRRLFLDITDDAELDGAEVVMMVEVVDKDGVTLSDERTLTAIPHPFNDEGR